MRFFSNDPKREISFSEMNVILQISINNDYLKNKLVKRFISFTNNGRDETPE